MRASVCGNHGQGQRGLISILRRSRLEYGTSSCDQHRLPAEDLERDIFQHVIQSLEDETLLTRAWADYSQSVIEGRPRIEAELRKLVKETKRTRDGIDKYLRAFESGSMPAETCGPRLLELQGRLGEIEARRADLREDDGRDETASLEVVKQLASEFGQALVTAEKDDLPKLKGLLRILLPKILVESRSGVKPFIHMPLVSIMANWVGPAGIEPATNRL